MSKLYIFCGLPFSGKTTITKRLADLLSWKRIDLDEVKFDLFGINVKDADIDQEGWDKIYQEMYQRIDRALDMGETVIQDAGNFTKSERDIVRGIGEKHAAEAITVFVDTSVNEARKRLTQNRNSKERFNVSDEDFESTVKEMEPPGESEKHLIYKETDSIESWIAENFK